MKKSIVWKGAFFVNWGIILWFWWSGSGRELTSGEAASAAIALGRLLGLAAAYMILLQFFFMGRMPWLERVFGLDRLSRIHHTNGKWGLFFLVFHPVLLTWGYSRSSGTTLTAQFKSFLFEYEHAGWAALGFMLFIVVVGSSIYVVRKRLRYEAWYFVHLIAYLAVFVSFWHQIAIGADFLAQNIFYWYWISLYAAVFASHAVFRFIRPVRNYVRHRFFVNRIVRENYNTVSIYIGGRNLEAFPVRPGQFMIFRFFAGGLFWQAHPFSLSLFPNGRELRITVKELGDFTKQLAGIPPGARVMIDGPYGTFTEAWSAAPKTLFIAGGIGITPIRSLFEEMAAHKKDVVLLYANRTQKDVVFESELEAISKNSGAKVTHVLSNEPEYRGEKGMLDEERIARLVPDMRERDIYLCGPPPMMEAFLQGFRRLGMPSARIHYERFSL